MNHWLLRYCSAATTVLALVLSICVFAPLAPQGSVNAQTPAPNPIIYALVSNPGLGVTPQRLVSFMANTPGTFWNDSLITGLQAGETLKGIDFRPATGELYGLGSLSRLYMINPSTGVATPVGGAAFTPPISSVNFYGFDFNPVPDRIRVVGGAVNNQNLRLNPVDGTVAGTDTPVAYDTGDVNAANPSDVNTGPPNIVAAAYSNNTPDQPTTTNYALDARADGTVRLVTQGTANFPRASPSATDVSPNTGRLFTVRVNSGDPTDRGNLIAPDAANTPLRSNNLIGFDIAGSSGTAYVSLTPINPPPTPINPPPNPSPINPFNTTSSLYTVNLTTRVTTRVGFVGSTDPNGVGGVRVEGLTVATPNALAAAFQVTAAPNPAPENAGTMTVTVTRADATAAATLQYATTDGTASQRSDYIAAAGTLTFAAGATSQTIPVFITDDVLVEGNETFAITLSDPRGGAPFSATTITITDNDTAVPTTNPTNNRDFFVRQQYRDFLNRDADAAGLTFWGTEYDQRVGRCSTITDATERGKCVLRGRASVSSAFFLSREFQQTGYLVYRAYDVAFARQGATRPALGQPATRTALRLEEYLPDVQNISRGVVIGQANSTAQLEANTVQFFQTFVQRTAFATRFNQTTADAYVDALFTSSGITPTAQDRQAAITAYGSGDTAGRAAALRRVAESEQVFQREFNRAFVLMQYFGYLRRDPDDEPEASRDLAGYNFWVSKLDSFSRAGEDVRTEPVQLGRVQRAEMIEAFIGSAEYVSRFGPNVQ